ncbi:MAG TPA: TrkA C-terminal domain-containing protein [Oscillospiraceae bacterium]|nr:TrkA C-terminal domain-containing protein [Oscillospiraceae bacterium]
MFVELPLLFLVFALLYLIVEAATTMLMITGLDQHTARFQAISIITGTGYTTSESELITRHPVRRKIAMFLMIVGSISLAVVISILVRLLSSNVSGVELFLTIALLLILTLILRSRPVLLYFDNYLEKQMLKQPYIHKRTVEELLKIDEHFSIAEIQLSQNAPWLDQTLGRARLRDLGVLVLSIRRRDGNLIRAPQGADVLREGDILLVYGRPRYISEIIELAT